MFKTLANLFKSKRVGQPAKTTSVVSKVVPKSKTGRFVGGAAAATIALVGAWEGLRTTAYIDVVGVPTVCYGETRGVKLGDKYTKEQCQEMLGEGLKEYAAKVDACLVDPWKVPDEAYATFVSLAYNIGTAGFCKSSIARKANEGDLVGACHALRLYNKGGSPLRVIKGLDNRRKAEEAMCLKSVQAAKK